MICFGRITLRLFISTIVTIRAIYDESELPEEWSPKTGIEKPASQVRQAREYVVQGEIEAAKEVLIKNLEIDDLEMMASANEIKYERQKDFYINDFNIKSIPKNRRRNPSFTN